MKALKNKLALCLAAALGLAVALAACSNSSDNGNLLLLSFGGSDPTPSPSSATGDYKDLGNGTVQLGLWPQTIKADSVTVNESESKTVGDFTYYKGSDGEWYAKKDSKYYKVEPIEWRVLTSDFNGTGTKLLFSTKALVTQAWYDGGKSETGGVPDAEKYRTIDNVEGILPCNYKYSRARAYLNGLRYIKKTAQGSNQDEISFIDKGFLNTAFTGAQQGLIATTRVDNSATSADGATATGKREYEFQGGDNPYCDNTDDKIFLLSQKEVTTEAYGFNPASNTDYQTEANYEPSRTVYVVDFSKGIYSNSSGEVTYWWLRSPAKESSGDTFITIGHAIHGNVYYNGFGTCTDENYYIVPALCLKAGN